MTVDVVRLHGNDSMEHARQALAALCGYLDRCALAANTVTAYRRQAAAYVAWLAGHTAEHPDAFADAVGAEAAVTAWRRHLLATGKAGPSTVNQALAAVTLLYEHGHRLKIRVKRARIPKPGAPDALTTAAEGAVRRAADRRGARDAAVIAVLLGTGARVEECARLDVADVAITPRTGTVRLFGKGDETRSVPIPAPARQRLAAWLLERAPLFGLDHATPDPGKLWIGQRGPMGVDGITKVVLAVGRDAGVAGLRPHRLRHTYATRLREGGADPAQIQALLGHAAIESSARYFRASDAEVAELVDRVLGR
jgi:site-specific recombinase XerD